MKLWSGQTISQLGSRITRDGLPLLAVMLLSATPVQMGYMQALGGLPVLLVGWLAGVWVDRLPRRPILILADLGRAALLGLIPLAAWLGILRIEHLYVLVTLVGCLTILFDVAYRSYLPSLVNQGQIVEGNSKLEISESLAEIAGPGLAGVLVQTLTAPIAILFDSLSFLVSVVSLGIIRKKEPPHPIVKAGRSATREALEGLKSVVHHPVLRPIAIATGILSLLGNFYAPLYSLYAIRILGLTPAALGLTIAMGGIGSLLGAFLAQRSLQRFGLGRTLIGSLFIMSSFSLLTPLAHGSLWLAAGFLSAAQIFGDCLRTIYFITQISLRQAVTPDDLLGRTNASIELISAGTQPVGALVGGVLGGLIGIRTTLLLAALGGAFAGLWLLLSPIRHIKTMANIVPDREHD